MKVGNMQDFNNKLISLISELNAPKKQYNKFGGYNYRSQEDILEAVKPLLVKYGLRLKISDEVITVGDRYYVKATATLTDGENAESSSALAREEENKKGMDSSQLTGATSSYARKYALNGLLCIDDVKDSDATNNHSESTPVAKKQVKATAEPKTVLTTKINANGVKFDGSQIIRIKAFAKKLKIEENKLIARLNKITTTAEIEGLINKMEELSE